MNKLFIAQLIDVLNRIAMQSKSKTVDLASKANATRVFKTLYKIGTDIYGYNFAKKLLEAKITDADDLKQLLISDDFRQKMMEDRQGAFLIKKIKLPTKAEIGKEMKAIYDKYKDQMSDDPDDVDDPLHTYAVRTQFSDGPVVFVDGIKSEAGRKEIRKWYAWLHKINYFQVRECSFEYWLKHPEVQSSTDHYQYQNDDLYKHEDNIAAEENLVENVNESFFDDGGRRFNKRRMIDDMASKRYNKYGRFDDLEDDFDDLDDDFEDIYNRNNTDDFYDDLEDDKEQDIFESSENETFAKGDMVRKINGNSQGFIIIDVLESEADIESAKRKRNYRRMLPKDFEVSENNPALAVMTVKGPKGGLNYIYPAIDFKHIE